MSDVCAEMASDGVREGARGDDPGDFASTSTKGDQE